MQRLPAFVLAAALLAWPDRAQAQTTDFTHAYQSWFQFTFQGPIHQDLFFQADLQYRGYDDFSPALLLFRAALAWRPLDGMLLGMGYAWTPGFRAHEGGGFFDEHRIFQNWQWELLHRETAIRFLMRFRVEERFRYPTGAAEVGVRIRQMLRLMVPLTTDRAVSLIAYDEFFLDVTESGHSPAGLDMMGNDTFSPAWEAFGYDQNRAFLGLGYQFIPSVLRLELGYMNQWIRRPDNPGGDAMNHIAVLNTVINWR
jgi:Protein of unknown function (DUF2490)